MSPEELSDIELWDRAVHDDHRAFGTLFDRHARSVYNHCFSPHGQLGRRRGADVGRVPGGVAAPP